MIFEKYIPGYPKNAAYNALAEMMNGVDIGASYADMIRYRISGAAADDCKDIYYVAHEHDNAIARLWNGWGQHSDAIGNWGNFYTDAAYRGKGIGGKVLKFWYEDFRQMSDPPLCFLCSAATKELTDLYRRFGFRPALENTEFGPLYLPVGDSPETFREFYQNYYTPSDVLYHKKANVGYRHEIDCLLRFVYRDLGLTFGIDHLRKIEEGILRFPERCGMLFSQDGHCVGWSFDKKIQVHPMYRSSSLVDVDVFN